MLLHANTPVSQLNEAEPKPSLAERVKRYPSLPTTNGQANRETR